MPFKKLGGKLLGRDRISGWVSRRDPLLSVWKWLDEEVEEGKRGQEMTEEAKTRWQWRPNIFIYIALSVVVLLLFNALPGREIYKIYCIYTPITFPDKWPLVVVHIVVIWGVQSLNSITLSNILSPTSTKLWFLLTQPSILRNCVHIGFFCTSQFRCGANIQGLHRKPCALNVVKWKVRVWRWGWWIGISVSEFRSSSGGK